MTSTNFPFVAGDFVYFQRGSFGSWLGQVLRVYTSRAGVATLLLSCNKRNGKTGQYRVPAARVEPTAKALDRVAKLQPVTTEARRLIDADRARYGSTWARASALGDGLAFEYACQRTLSELVNDPHGYVPTIPVSKGDKLLALAELYDYAQERLGRETRAYRR